MKEIWKDIPGYEGYYQASNLGRIKSLLFQNNMYNKKFPREKILKPKVSKNKCSRVDLWKDGKHKTWLTYRLVAITFLENNLNTNLTINHKDGNRLNNNINNLEWVSLKDNIRHGFRTGLYTCSKKIRIEDKITGTVIYPSSLQEGCKIINKHHSYLSSKIKNNVFEDERYRWSLLKKE